VSDAERVLRLLTNASVLEPDIASVLDISIRAVQKAIRQLRLEGKPVYSSGDGIRLAVTSDEALTCYRSLRARSLRQMHTARRLLDTAIAMQKAENRPPEIEAPEGSLWRVA
jgi:biotin operon repressor